MGAKSTNTGLKIAIMIAIILFLLFVFLDRINPEELPASQEVWPAQIYGTPE
jgi:hypothetical protein